MNKTYSSLFLQPGDNVLLSHRRLYVDDKSRFFVGTVLAFSETNGLLKVEGFSISQPTAGTHFVKKISANAKIVSLTSGTVIVYQLPEIVDVTKAILVFKNGQTLLEDGNGVSIDLTE